MFSLLFPNYPNIINHLTNHLIVCGLIDICIASVYSLLTRLYHYVVAREINVHSCSVMLCKSVILMDQLLLMN